MMEVGSLSLSHCSPPLQVVELPGPGVAAPLRMFLRVRIPLGGAKITVPDNGVVPRGLCRARWVTLRARWVMLRASWVTSRCRTCASWRRAATARWRGCCRCGNYTTPSER
jgi:hypothetical protein